MLNCNCERNCTCVGLSIAAAVIIGIIAAFFRFFAVITPAPAFFGVLLGVGIIYPAVLLLASPRIREDAICTCVSLFLFVLGAAGTIITSLVLLGIAFAATSIIGAIIFGLALAFFTLLISSVLCIIYSKCSRN